MSDQPQRRLTPAVWLATGFGVGLVAPAPGTVGALWGLLWAWLLLLTDNPWWWLTVPAGILLGVPLCTRAASDLGDEKDPGAIVWDEIATVPIPTVLIWLIVTSPRGMMPVMELTPYSIDTFVLMLIAFGLHRLFDITKPWPCRRLEKLPDGLGVMADDIAASVYAVLAMYPCFVGFATLYFSLVSMLDVLAG